NHLGRILRIEGSTRGITSTNLSSFHWGDFCILVRRSPLAILPMGFHAVARAVATKTRKSPMIAKRTQPTIRQILVRFFLGTEMASGSRGSFMWRAHERDDLRRARGSISLHQQPTE